GLHGGMRGPLHFRFRDVGVPIGVDGEVDLGSGDVEVVDIEVTPGKRDDFDADFYQRRANERGLIRGLGPMQDQVAHFRTEFTPVKKKGPNLDASAGGRFDGADQASADVIVEPRALENENHTNRRSGDDGYKHEDYAAASRHRLARCSAR